MKSTTSDPAPPPLPKEWDSLPRMSFTSAPAPSPADEQRTDIAFGVRTAEKLGAAFQVRERRLKK